MVDKASSLESMGGLLWQLIKDSQAWTSSSISPLQTRRSVRDGLAASFMCASLFCFQQQRPVAKGNTPQSLFALINYLAALVT